MADVNDVVDDPFVYSHHERRPVEVLVYEVDPAHLDEFLRVDHEIWTLGEAFADGLTRIPFISKEVWLDDSRPGEVTLVFVWESMQTWQTVDDEPLQSRLQARFDAEFHHPVRLVRALHEESDLGIHRWSRFERSEDSRDSGGRSA
jgi:uncharacterized protein (TIGR03792 family)